MAQKRRYRVLKAFFVEFLILNFIGFSAVLIAAETNKKPEQLRYRVFSLRKGSAEQGVQILKDAGIGTVSRLPGANTLLVTGSRNQLVSAANILRLIDTDEQYSVQRLCDASEAPNLPSIERLVDKTGNMSIGTFSKEPAGDGPVKVMIDVCGDKVVVIAPSSHINRIVQAVGELMKKPQAPQLGDIAKEKPEEQAIPKDIANEDELFNKLIKSLGQAESAASQQKLVEKKTGDQRVAAEEIRPARQPQIEETNEEQPVRGEPDEPAGENEKPIRSYQPEPVEIADEMLELNLPEKLNIIDLVDLVGKYLNLDYMYDPKEVVGDVSLKLQGPMKIRDLYPLLESVLKFRGFVMSRNDNLVTIVKSDKALDIDPTLLHDGAGSVQYGDVIVTRVFELQYLSTQSAQNLLGQLKLGVNITPISETGTLIVTGYTQRMNRIEQILRVVDKPGVPREFRYRQLRYTMAKNLVSKVDKLAEELGTVSVTVAAPAPEKPPARRTARRRPRRPQRPTPAVTEAGKPTVYLDVDERTNRILMIGQTGQLDVVEKLIDALDVEKQDLRTLRLYDIQYVGAEEVRKKLEELGIIGKSAETKAAPSVRSRARTAKSEKTEAAPVKSRQARPARGGTSEELAPLAEEPQVVIIESTNSLLVNATSQQHAQIAVIIGYVDSETVEQAIPYEIYQLENQKPDDIAAVLQKLVEETITDKEGKVEKVVKRQEDIVIVPDENTFSLIVYASRKNQEWIKKLIGVLDKRRPQVLIDVTLVQIAKTDQFEFDLDLLSSFPDLTNTSGLTQALMGDNNNTNLVPKLVSHPDRNRDRFVDFQTSGGAGVGFYGDRHINALLTAMQAKSYGRVLAKPKILVNDNEEGVIKTTDTTYVEKRSSTPLGTTGETGQQATLVTTAVDYQGYDAGITLNITPHISDSDLLRLEINLTRSDFGTVTGLKPPDITSSDIDTIVTVPDGSTIILGGLLKLNQSKGGSKIPLLGDIPLIGGLFRSVSNSDIQRKLYIFVKAEIIRPEDAEVGMASLVNISDRNRKAFEQYEDKFQKLQDWPGFEPEPIDPLKVLEAE